MATVPTSLRERQRQEREQLILQAAEESLLERGYHDTSIDDIAARVGISKGTVYLHFPSKEDLVLALFDRAIRAFLSAVDETLASAGTPRDKLRAIIEHAYGTLSERHIYLIGTLAQSPDMLKRMADKRELMATTMGELEWRISSLLEAGKAAGQFDTAIPTPVMMSLFTSLLAPHNYRRLVMRGGMTPAEAIAHMSRFFFKGIAAGQRSDTPDAHDTQAD
jgi:TetR/AcrR family transcriptional regulator, fatty acid metabolism regulator protein